MLPFVFRLGIKGGKLVLNEVFKDFLFVLIDLGFLNKLLLHWVLKLFKNFF